MNPIFQKNVVIPTTFALVSGSFFLPVKALANNVGHAKIQATTTVKIISPLIASQRRLLHFVGEFECEYNQECTITLSPLGVISHTDDNDDIEGTFKPAIFDIKGSANQSYQITLPDELRSDPLIVTDFTAISTNSATSQGLLDSNGLDEIYIGATLIIPAGFELDGSLQLEVPLTIYY